MRRFYFCPSCGGDIKSHIASNLKCLPFLSGANHEKGHFVYDLDDHYPEEKNSLLFNLISYREYRSVSEYDYPEISAISHCPYCGKKLRAKNGAIGVERDTDPEEALDDFNEL